MLSQTQSGNRQGENQYPGAGAVMDAAMQNNSQRWAPGVVPGSPQAQALNQQLGQMTVPQYAQWRAQNMPGSGGQQPQPQQSGPPNNWQAALSALANPGNPQTMGATVPEAQGFQPSGGVNQAFLQQAQGRPGGNQGFQSALAAIQGRPFQ
jgi:hypothetical protein